ncbi:MAG: 2-C-methyl-D-erythritol 2,4-cyclodiphosphate synthase [candidate division KSB1 bacterium]|nr:2-C-methyl-D-erythritol 2,4-cyclodiphosphate synthase [candidate division KSB1 bacterium]MDZ7340378.1 2-C-methyl-D-erythritol 2,4-cyclodiphosphate synthase [candidate division KSB1 bacterium]
MNFRVGLGYDFHRLVPGRKLILGGVPIPFSLGLQGHSDADVLCHAIGDALLGAAALGDLGQHFPDQDERYRNISSLFLLNEIKKMLRQVGLMIVNIDTVIIAEAPKLSSFYEAMRKNIATNLSIQLEQISVKATTTEGAGLIGAGEGIAAYASCVLQSDPESTVRVKS